MDKQLILDAFELRTLVTKTKTINKATGKMHVSKIEERQVMPRFTSEFQKAMIAIASKIEEIDFDWDKYFADLE